MTLVQIVTDAIQFINMRLPARPAPSTLRRPSAATSSSVRSNANESIRTFEAELGVAPASRSRVFAPEALDLEETI